MSDSQRVVKYDPLLPFAKLFLCVNRAARPKLDLECEWDRSKWRFRGPDALGIAEQTLLLVLMELASECREAWSDDEVWTEVRAGLEADQTMPVEMRRARLATIRTSYRELCRRCGVQGDGGSARAQVRKQLERLCEVTIWQVTPEGGQLSSKLAHWRFGTDTGVLIMLNWRLSSIVVLHGQYVGVSLRERFALKSDSARALHCVLSAYIRPRRQFKYRLTTLASYIWGEGEVTEGTKRRQRQEVLLALQQLVELGTWAVEIDRRDRAGDSVATISRLSNAITPRASQRQTKTPEKQKKEIVQSTSTSTFEDGIADISYLFQASQAA